MSSSQPNLQRTPRQRVTRLAEAALENYGLGGASVSLVSGGSSKQILYVISEKGREYGLRMYKPIIEQVIRDKEPIAYLHSETALHSQLLWISAMQGDPQLTLPQIWPTRDGELVSNITLEGEPRGRHVMLLSWVPGEHRYFETQNMQTDVLEELDMFRIGAYMARLHRRSEHFSLPENFLRPIWDYESMFGEEARMWKAGELIFSRTEMELLGEVADRVKENLRAYGKPKDRFGLIHRDLQPKNIVFYNDYPIAIDFDHCGWGYYLYDLAFLLLHIDQARDDFFRESMKDGLISGYMSERPLPQEDLQYLETFVMMRYVGLLNYLLWTLEKRPASRYRGTEKLANVIARLREFNSRHQRQTLGAYLRSLRQ